MILRRTGHFHDCLAKTWGNSLNIAYCPTEKRKKRKSLVKYAIPHPYSYYNSDGE